MINTTHHNFTTLYFEFAATVFQPHIFSSIMVPQSVNQYVTVCNLAVNIWYCNVLHPQNWINESHVKSQKNDQNRLCARRARRARRASSHSLLRSSEFKLRTRSSWIVPRLPTSWNIWNHIPKASQSIPKHPEAIFG